MAGAGGAPRTVLKFEVLDPASKPVLAREADKEGTFGWTSVVGGEHTLCLTTDTSSYMGQQRLFRMELAIDYGEAATDWTELAQHEHLSAIEVEIRKLNDKVRSIGSEQAYQRGREEAFRNTSESTNSRVMWWSIGQTIVLLLSGFWQINRLKTFFKQKKLA